ncbi:MAG TPA: outer membrane beta-barrel protein [Opitutaceae bacterium]|jgi:opacity protein-like surface antigen|nr:outer membrane beta-barrel protein [Opitutaceae bacterium]
MKTPYLTLVAVAALGAAALRAQTSPGDSSASPAYIPPPPAPAQPDQTSANPGTPPPPAMPMPYRYGYGPAPSLTLAGSIDFPYAFKWDAPGVSGELGALWNRQHFFGGEISYYGGDYKHYRVFNGTTFLGSFTSAPRVTTVEAAYRYFAPLWTDNGRPAASFYVGGGAGVGFVDYTDGGAVFGFRSSTNGAFTAEGVAGIQLNTWPGASLRLGYRYIDISDVWQFNHRGDFDSGAFEVGASFRL